MDQMAIFAEYCLYEEDMDAVQTTREGGASLFPMGKPSTLSFDRYFSQIVRLEPIRNYYFALVWLKWTKEKYRVIYDLGDLERNNSKRNDKENTFSMFDVIVHIKLTQLSTNIEPERR